MLNVVLVEPEIPQNCGNIARTCAATGARLHLVKPLGFDVSDRAVKRAGLDYWRLVEVTVYENLDEGKWDSILVMLWIVFAAYYGEDTLELLGELDYPLAGYDRPVEDASKVLLGVGPALFIKVGPTL